MSHATNIEKCAHVIKTVAKEVVHAPMMAQSIKEVKNIVQVSFPMHPHVL